MSNVDTSSHRQLWYAKPASTWTEALPIGNGRLGAMVFGGVDRDELQLNEDTFWSGGPYNPVNPKAKPDLETVRALIFAGRFAEAEALANASLMADPYLQMSYQPVGNVFLDCAHDGEMTDYTRRLDLEHGIVETRYSVDGISFRREYFASAPDNIIIIRLTCDRPGALTVRVRLESPQDGVLKAAETGALVFLGMNRGEHGIAGALHFAAQVRVASTDGQAQNDEGSFRIRSASEIILHVDMATSFVRFDQTDADPVERMRQRHQLMKGRGYASILADHVSDYQSLFFRQRLMLGAGPQSDLPTDERIANFSTDKDPDLAALYVDFGRYLMIACSRNGSQPANLQGIWNKETIPPWGSKYTANINLQMNYWLPGPANLADCFEPFQRLLKDVAVAGSVMAEEHYGARGWVLHHNTDLWRATGPIDGAKWGLWPMGGAWLCVQTIDFCRRQGDWQTLLDLYPVLKGAALFLLDVLQPLPGTPFKVTNPSLSPENVHPFGAAICAGPTMDNQIMRDLFGALKDMAAQLPGEEVFVLELEAGLSSIPPDRCGAAGQLQEWLEDWDMQAPEMDHRHVSHLYGLYPSWQINMDDTKELAAAARRSLEIRGDLATGWGIGWRINLWARLRDGNHAHFVLTLLLSPERTYPNMFDAHPPFQIDGNFGGATGILEMILQARPGQIHLLPAIPDHWHQGEARGFCAYDGITLDLVWRESRPTHIVVRAIRDTELVIRFGNEAFTADFKAGTSREIRF